MMPRCLQDSASLQEDVAVPQPYKTTPNLGDQVASNGLALPRRPMSPYCNLHLLKCVPVTQSYLDTSSAALLTAVP